MSGCGVFVRALTRTSAARCQSQTVCFRLRHKPTSCRSLLACHVTTPSRSRSTYKDSAENANKQKAQEENRTGTSSQSSQGDETEYEHAVRHRILQAALSHVFENGWTQKALEAGAKEEGLPPVAHGMFPKGGAELIHYFVSKSNSELAEILKKEAEETKSRGLEINSKAVIRHAVEIRLRFIIPYLDSWPQALAISALPQNIGESFSDLLNLTNEIWYYAGDRSVDFNWYTKRLALATVYRATEVYMIQDKSEDLRDTWAFLDNRLKDLEKFGAAKKSCEQTGEVLKEALVGFSILGRNVLGLNSRNR